VVTGTRAEFGLLEPVMRAIAADRRLRPCAIATGTHLTTGTWRDIRAAGFDIEARVRMQRKGQSGRSADVAALARGVAGFGRQFESIRPDFVVVLGDRIEVLAAASAASIGGYRIAHLHGGDRAEGVADEAMRHAVSKLAHVHLAATAQSRRRLIRMGEDAAAVFNVGSPAADGLRDIEPADDAPDVIVLQHPIGAEDTQEAQWMAATLRAIARRRTRLVMAPNHDAGARGIRRALRAARDDVVEHLPRRRWLSVLAGAKVIVGNSSAGLIDAAILRTPCVNIGPRQGGREKPANVIDCDYGQRPVRAAIDRALQLDLRRMRHPYGDGRSGRRIAERLAAIDLHRVPLRKRNTY
jgi:UDP-hydrolysing UDP-N-acetyl-D-glucosamine 2-epimerase